MTALREFDFPLRVYWDLTKGDGYVNLPLGADRAIKICDELVGLKILNLSLLDTGQRLSAACTAVLDRMKNENMAVTLAASVSAVDPSVIKQLDEMHLKALFIDAGAEGGLGSAGEKIRQCNNAGLQTGLYFRVTRNNFRALPEVLSFCLDNGITHLVIPMQRLMEEGECFYITEDERKALASGLERPDRRGDVRITINDPFLWRAFYPAEKYHESGCQAANSMIYLSPEGDVFPCPAMPLKLGNLSSETLEAILFSPAKKDLRKGLGTPPEGCGCCEELNVCLGGCRGRTYALRHSFNEPDPSCR